jgi:hypothetical protein
MKGPVLGNIIEYISKRSEIAMKAGEYEQKRKDILAMNMEFVLGVGDPAMTGTVLSVISSLQ